MNTLDWRFRGGVRDDAVECTICLHVFEFCCKLILFATGFCLTLTLEGPEDKKEFGVL